jgi:hypothetical protein
MLISCAECGKQYSNNATACPSCANPTPPLDPQQELEQMLAEARETERARALHHIRKGQPNRFIAQTTGLSFKEIDKLRAQVAAEVGKTSESQPASSCQSEPQPSNQVLPGTTPTPESVAATPPGTSAEGTAPDTQVNPADSVPIEPTAIPNAKLVKPRRGYSSRPRNDPSVAKELTTGLGIGIASILMWVCIIGAVLGVAWGFNACTSAAANSPVFSTDARIITEINARAKGTDFIPVQRIEWIVREGSEWRGVTHHQYGVTGNITYYPSTGKWFVK